MKTLEFVDAETAIEIMNKEIRISELKEHNDNIKTEIKRVKKTKAQQIKIEYGFHTRKSQLIWNLECRIEENKKLINAIQKNIDKLMAENTETVIETPENFDPLSILING